METKVLQVPEGRQLATQLSSAKKRQKVSDRGSQNDQMSHTSIDDVAIPVIIDRQVAALFGRQADGTAAIKYTNTTPPTVVPSAPILTGRQISFLYEYDGLIDGGLALPANVTALDVHASTTQGFEITGATRIRRHSLDGNDDSLSDTYSVGSMSTHYVKFVFVTNAGAKGPPSVEVAVDPLGASDLAIEQIATAMIHLLGKIRATNASGDTLEFSASGFHGVKADLTPWLTFDLATTTGFFSGEYTTALSGGRWVDNPGGNQPDVRRVYPSGSANYAQIQGIEVSSQAGILLQGNSTRGDGMSGQVVGLPDFARMGFANYESDEAISEWFCEEGYSRGRAPVVDLIADHGYAQPDGNHRIALLHYDSNGNIIQNSLLQFELFGGANELVMYNPRSPNDESILWGSHRFFFCQGRGGASRADIEYRTAFATSSIEEKEEFRPRVEESLPVVLAAVPELYQYRNDDSQRDHFGPMAEDLPPHLTHISRMGNRVVDHLSMTGELWAASRELAEITMMLSQENTAQQAQIDDLLARVAALEAQANA